MKPLTELDPEAVTIVYFRADTQDVIDGIEVSWDNGATWAQLPEATDDDDLAAYTLIVRGPTADSTAGRLLPLGRNHGLVRVADNPEITVKRFLIEVRAR